MANLEKMTAQYVDEGYSELLAEARVCQDLIYNLPVGYSDEKNMCFSI